jgi:cytochrome c peroxidase
MGTPGGTCVSGQPFNVVGEITSLAYDGQDRVWAQMREPAQLVIVTGKGANTAIPLATMSRADTGWAVFHSNSGAFLACASCHPEGHEDGRVWQFADVGPRRTQTLRGHIGGTEPFHWNGDLANFDALLGEVYLKRMAGPMLPPDQKSALLGWVNSIPTVPHSPPADPAAVMRGQAIFEDTKNVGCNTCHSGPQLSNNSTVDVGTGGSFQVPRLLGVGWRAPYLHDGCAPSLADRFGPCGGGDQHGITSQLTAAQKADLIAYLSTL